MKIRPLGVELFHAEGWIDRQATKLVVAFRNFANAPKKVLIWNGLTSCVFNFRQ